MSFDINTNITSLQAQQYLRVNSDFQAKTINRVTSGLRILSSGDDAAGLAIANGFRSDQAVLTQGIRNANDGLSTLQTIDGGMNNISQLLDRARTLATQSASGTFNGSRDLLNSEFTSVLGEIDRQSQSIGLNVGGTFAKSLSVFIGGGRGPDSAAVITNGSVSVDLSSSTVDSRSLGLQAYEAKGAGSGDFTATGMGVSNIITTNAPAGNLTTFKFNGPGFGDANGVSVQVNLNSVQDATTLAAAINSAISSIQATSPANLAFINAGVTAGVSSDGKALVFDSKSTAFQVEASDATAAAFLGFTTTNIDPTGLAPASNNTKIEAGGIQATATITYGTGLVKATPEKQELFVSTTDASGAAHTLAIGLTGLGAAGANQTLAEALGQINTALQNSADAALKNIVAVSMDDGTTHNLEFISTNPTFSVSVGANTGVANHGLGSQNTIVDSAASGTATSADISTQAGAQSAVAALSAAVASLGSAQAVVGKGQNQFNYAVNLAQSQLTNLAAAESRIRDADLAAEAANLTKAQILLQAGTAALAQANSSSQAVLALLR